jgi:deoxyhypusine synthase
MGNRHTFLGGNPIEPKAVTGSMTVAELVESSFLAYNAARLREACQLFVEKMLEEDVPVGMSLTGALTPAGLGMSAIIPLIENGFVDWIVSTGANLKRDPTLGRPSVRSAICGLVTSLRRYDLSSVEVNGSVSEAPMR